ncbi:hypothetical protein PMAYCL1PPCAC_28923, partial [Pristionchus mayeri]
SGHPTVWFFLLLQLVDPTKKSMIAWTGNGLEFRIVDHDFSFNYYQISSFQISWESLKRNIRNCYQKGILKPTNSRNFSYAFLTEPSIHIGFPPKMLDIYIKLNHVNGPLTIGSPIDFPLPRSIFQGNKM